VYLLYDLLLSQEFTGFTVGEMYFYVETVESHFGTLTGSFIKGYDRGNGGERNK